MVIYRALNPDASLAPVILLSGGPGVAALGRNGKAITARRSLSDRLFPGRTVVIFDQRGMGLGSSRLDCHYNDDPTLGWPVSKSPGEVGNSPARVRAADAACAKRLIDAGHQLDAFNTTQSANDVEALRRALKLGDVVLYGTSYGTQLALTVMKFHPERIQAAILDSVFPPQALFPALDAGKYGAALERLFAACNQDRRCATDYPDLRGRFFHVLDQLAQEPAVVEISNKDADTKDEQQLYVRVDHRMFLAVIRNQMSRTARALPALISGVAQGEYWRLKQSVKKTIYNDSSLEMAAFVTITCNDGVLDQRPDSDAADAHSHLRDYAAWNREFWDCSPWPAGERDTLSPDPVVSDIPSLLLAGGLDPATTVEHAEMAARTLHTSHLFVFPAVGHEQLSHSKCARAVLREFLANPTDRPDPTCVTSLRQPQFLATGGH